MAILVSAVSGFIAGLLASIFSTGVRKMLAPLILPKKLHLGKISPSNANSNFPNWYIPVSVKAKTSWNLLVSSMEGIRAYATFINRDNNEKAERLATWLEPDIDAPSITLHIGGEYDLRIATIFGGVLRMVGGTDQKDSLSGNYDIMVTLRSGKKILGQWLSQKAIVEGSMQEISPINVNSPQVISHKEGSWR
jgi:hypothetical protein